MFIQGGEYNTKRAKVEQETEGNFTDESQPERCTTEVKKRVPSTSMEAVQTISVVKSIDQKADYDKLPAEMHAMKIKDNKSNRGNDKVI